MSVPDDKSRRRRSVALWVLIAWTVVMLMLVIAGVTGGHDSAVQECERHNALGWLDCQDTADSSTSVDVAVLVFVWAFGLVCIAAVTVIVRLGRRS